VELKNDDTAAWVSIEDVAACAGAVDDQVRAVLGRVMAQRRSVATALAYVCALAPGVKANCWSIAEAAGHEGWHRMQALLGSYRWDPMALRGQLPALAGAWLPCDPGDLIGPGVAVDETAQLKHGDATACVAPQHAGCTGKVENCVTTVFSAYVTTSGQAWVDFDVYLPQRWAADQPRRQDAGIPDDLAMQTKPQLAIAQLTRLTRSGLPIRWVAFDEVYGRSSTLRRTCQQQGLTYVAIVPRDFQITTGAGTVIRVDEAVTGAVFERRACGTGTKGPRVSDWAMVGTASPRHVLLIRRLICRPDQLTFYLCYAPPGRPATMTYFITIAGRRWPVEETFKTGKDVLGWDQCQARIWNALCRHTALAALAQLRQAAIRNTVCGDIQPPADPTPPQQAHQDTTTGDGGDQHTDDADLRIPLGDAPIPTHPGQPPPPHLGLIKLTIAETARLTRLATDWITGLITRARLAFKLRWSARRRRHQATARWHHHATRLTQTLTQPHQPETVTARNRQHPQHRSHSVTPQLHPVKPRL
jgi:SRSO17 transposase